MNLLRKKVDMQNRYYEALTPATDISNGQEYMAALDWAIEQENIHNIAISGPYGSGKSSVIESYRKNHKNIKTLSISLAAFNLESMKVKNDDEEEEFPEKQLEIGILKQLFYSVGVDKVPQSRYRKIHPQKWYINMLQGFLLWFLLCVVINFLFPDKVNVFTDQINNLSGKIPNFIYWGLFSSMSIACILLLEWFKRNVNIREVKILDKATFKNEKGSDESIFNRNMDEIVYFFEETGYELVIIEDLDRFKSTNIFVSLRDLNILLNNYEKIKKKITFIYAIKDDMFEKGGERTKFFDFIIPIVPYISSTNSEEILREKLHFDNLENKSSIYDISGEFINLISPYIKDMRELVCICNEFNIYKNTIKSNQELSPLIDEKMFSLIVFKNLYPKDFAELENEAKSSIVRMAFMNKRAFIDKEEELIDEKRSSEADKIRQIEGEALNSIRELKLALFGCLMNYKSSVKYIYDGEKKHSIESMLKDEFIIDELRGKSLDVYWANDQYSNNFTSVNDIEQELEKNGGNYFERIERVNKGVEECIDESRREIEKYEKEIYELHTQSISEIIGKYGIYFLNKSVKENDLLVFLLRRGYIDEQYESYINYFHPNSITKEEMNFVLGVRNHRFEIDYTYPLKNIEQIFDRLHDFEFKQTEVLNYDLVDFVLEKRDESDSANILIEQLSNHSAESMSFIKAYIDRGMNTEIFIHRLCNKNSLFWKDITNDDGISLETRFKYLEFMLKFANIDDIVKQDWINRGDDKGILSEIFISYPLVLIKIKNVLVDTQINLINMLNIKFTDVELGGVDESIIKYIFENQHYVLNKVMIKKLLEWKAPELVKDLPIKNYTTILKLDYKPLLEYIHKNFGSYILEMIVNPESNVNETLDAVEDILERFLLEDVDLCIKVLDKEQVVWDEITLCCEGMVGDKDEHVKMIWNYLLSNNRVSCTWSNFIEYYNRYGSTETWNEYFNNNIDILLDDHCNSLITEDIKSVLLLSDMPETNFRKFISMIDLSPYMGELDSLNETKIKVMIEESKLLYTVKYWNDLANLAPALRVLYAEQNKTDFIKSVDDIKLTEKEVNSMLISNVFSPKNKKIILAKLDVDTLSIETAKVIRELDFTIDREYVDAARDILPENDRYQLLINQLSVYENEELPEIFGKLAPEYEQLVKRTKHKFIFRYTDFNRELLNKLHTRDYITSVEVEEVVKGDIQSSDIIKELVITGFVKQNRE